MELDSVDKLKNACKIGNLQELNRIIELGENDFNLGICIACENGHLNIVNRLIELGTDNFTPLDLKRRLKNVLTLIFIY